MYRERYLPRQNMTSMMVDQLVKLPQGFVTHRVNLLLNKTEGPKILS